ncbi:MAG: SH3 domain-containing protein [Hyphomicrobiaceae bacterium]
MRGLASTALLLTTVASAGAAELSGQQIRELVTGSLAHIDTPLGKKIAVRFAADGRTAGEAGELASYLGSASDTGHWWIEGDRLCQKWTHWLDRETQCLSLARSGPRLRWVNQAGTSGTASIAQSGRRAAVLSDASSTGRMRLAGPRVERNDDDKPVPGERTAAQPRPIAKAAAGAGNTAGQTHRVAHVAAGDVLNVRGGPSTDDAVVASLKPGEGGIAIAGECRARWCPITHGPAKGWVNVAYLEPEGEAGDQDRPQRRAAAGRERGARERGHDRRASKDALDAPRDCLTEPARAMLDQIEQKFGPVRVISTCRPGATIAGTGRPSHHASGNAVDFEAGPRKEEIVAWLAANHSGGGTMTYADMSHIHVDIGRHFVSLAGRHFVSLAGRRVRLGRAD